MHHDDIIYIYEFELYELRMNFHYIRNQLLLIEYMWKALGILNGVQPPLSSCNIMYEV